MHQKQFSEKLPFYILPFPDKPVTALVGVYCLFVYAEAEAYEQIASLSGVALSDKTLWLRV